MLANNLYWHCLRSACVKTNAIFDHRFGSFAEVNGTRKAATQKARFVGEADVAADKF